MGKPGKVLKAIGHFVDGAIKDMAADTPWRGVAPREEDIPPVWERKNLGI